MTDTTNQKRKRGKPRAPYTSSVARVPDALMPTILAMVAEYRAKAWAEARQQREANR